MGRWKLTNAINNIARESPDEIAHLLTFLKQIAYDVVLPVVAVSVGVVVGSRWLYAMYRIMVPPTAEVYHKMALGILKKGDTKLYRENVKKLLYRCIKRYPTYLPSYHSLAAIQLYQENSIMDALETIERGLKLFPKDKELYQMKLDAMALQANLGHMVHAGACASKYLGVAGWRTTGIR